MYKARLCLQVIVIGMSSSAAVDGEGLAYKSADYQSGIMCPHMLVQFTSVADYQGIMPSYAYDSCSLPV